MAPVIPMTASRFVICFGTPTNLIFGRSIPDRFKGSAIEACNMALDCYEQDYESEETKFRQLGYPNVNELHKRTLVTDREVAIRRVVEEALRDDSRPLWILVWGNMRFIGEVLEREPSVADKIRIITIGTFVKAPQDGGDGVKPNWNGAGRQRIFERFPDLWWLEIDWTYNGMFVGQEPIQLKRDLAHFGGALGQHISDVIDTVPWANNFRAGDTPSVLYMIDPSHDLDDPSQTSWAGQFEKPFPNRRPNYWIGSHAEHDWDFAEPQSTWWNAAGVYQARVDLFLRERPKMYASLLNRVQELYGTAGLKRPQKVEPKLPVFDPRMGLTLEAEGAEIPGGPTIEQTDSASGDAFVRMTDNGAIVWRFEHRGEPIRINAALRYRLLQGSQRQELFVNSANLGKVKFANADGEWHEYAFELHLVEGPNSIVLRKVTGNIEFDSISLTKVRRVN